MTLNQLATALAPCPESEIDDATLDAVAEAITRAACPGREGPYGGYDYGYNRENDLPAKGRYVVRDFRDPASPTWGEWVHQSPDREEHEAAFYRLTKRHIALAALTAWNTRIPQTLSEDWRPISDDGALERVIRPIVEGQIRSFVSDHPEVIETVTWYKPREDRAQTFVNSIAKRIIRDLLCSETRVRLVQVFGGISAAEALEELEPVTRSGLGGGRGGTTTAPAASLPTPPVSDGGGL